MHTFLLFRLSYKLIIGLHQNQLELLLKKLWCKGLKLNTKSYLTLSRPLDVPVRPRARSRSRLYLIYDLIYQFFHSCMKKSSKSSLKKKGLLIYLSSLKTELAINFLKKTFALGQKQGWR